MEVSQARISSHFKEHMMVIDETFVDHCVQNKTLEKLERELENVNPNLLTTLYGDTLFGHYVKKGNAEVVEIFLKKGINPDGKDLLGLPYLTRAVELCRFEVTKLLLGYGADTECIEELMKKAVFIQNDILDMAIRTGYADLARRVLTVDFSEKVLNASLLDCMDKCTELVSKNVPTREIFTQCKQVLTIADILIQRGANWRMLVERSDRPSSIILQCMKHKRGFVACLHEMQPYSFFQLFNKMYDESEYLLERYTANHNFEHLATFDELTIKIDELSIGDDANVDTQFDSMLVVKISFKDKKEEVEFKQAIQTQDSFEFQEQNIFDFAEAGNAKEVDRLLQIEGPNITDSKGRSLLDYALSSGDVETIRFILNAGANVQAPQGGKHPIEIALAYRNWDIARLFITYTDAAVMTPELTKESLRLAVEHGDTRFVNMWLRTQKALDFEIGELMQIAINGSNWCMIECLLHPKVVLSMRQVCFLLRKSIIRDNELCLKKLLLFDLNRLISQEVYTSLIAKACRLEREAMVKCLVEHTASHLVKQPQLKARIADAHKGTRNFAIKNILLCHRILDC